MPNLTIAEQLTKFTTELQLKDIPETARLNTKLHVLDTIGISLANSGSQTARKAKDVMSQLETAPQATVIGSSVKFSAPSAALINSTMAHGPDYDDTHPGSALHPSVVLVPAAMAVGECVNTSGAEFITAMTAGYEVLCRLGMTAPGAYSSRGYHISALLGGFGAALIAGKLEKLPNEVICNALGIAGSQASGILECLFNGSELKQIQPGWGAYCGIVATMLAKEGLAGPVSVFDGKFSFFNSHLPEVKHDLSAIVSGLGERWEVNEISFKGYPCCHHTQAFADCVKEIHNSNRFEPEDVEDIECLISAAQAKLVCEPIEAKRIPKSGYDGKFSVPYVVSVMLHRGKITLLDFEDEALQDEAVLRTAQKVRYTISDKTGFPVGFPGWVKLRLRDDRIFEHRLPTNLLGIPGYEKVAEEVISKFEDNASMALPPEQVAHLKDLIMDIENVSSFREISACLKLSD